LFQREASTLYQINHPQVPQFRATFEDEGRLFLVQDYVEGKTFRELLEERKTQGQTFSEAEVRQLVLQLLPVLEHIHSRGIIHRDLAPDNIILRQSDSLPVLIDFGVVKELATRIQGGEGTKAATTVGKIGFAPSEQIQMGRAYPSSDLYALAVTALVLLTGKEPRDLYDDVNLTWHWRQHATVSDSFAQVLNKMLSHRPGDRYQSAMEVQQALQSNAQTSPPDTQAEMSRMATVAVGRRPAATEPPSSVRNRPEPVIERPQNDSAWESPWTLWGLAAFLIAIAGLGSYGIFTALNETVETEPTPIEPTPTLSPVEPEVVTQRIEIGAGETFSERGILDPNTILNYVLVGESQQQLQATLESEGVWMTILQPNGSLIAPGARRVQSWEGELPADGDYLIQLEPIPGLSENEYRYRLRLRLQAAPEPTPTPELSPTLTPEPSPAPTTPLTPEVQTRPLNLSVGEELDNIVGRTSPEQIRRYAVNLEEGQRLRVSVAEGDVALTPRFPNGEPIPEMIGGSSFELDVTPLIGGGQYFIDVIADEATQFRLQAELEQVNQ
jgi:serine/threonine-protein kinase